ncbi:MAG: endonuclease V [Nitrososphaerota archaeon]|nr:endonuclease V [Candidatus Bathyarchaeota archaeon]MDW8023294.1 endonuclease V [Nitrososphaerota archaeon]
MSITKLGANFSIEKARKAQLHLSKQIVLRDLLPRKIRYIAGVDVAYNGESAIGAVAVLEYSTLNLVESQTAICKIAFPYIPTLLSFREVPPSVLCIRKLKTQPDVFLVDGHGFAHPYHCGFASHLGVVLRRPTIGVAKHRLIGEIEDSKDGDFARLKHEGEIVGAVLKTIRGHKPVYVSVGHMVSLETAVKIVRHCTRRSNIPEPLIKAHQTAAEAKNGISRLKAFVKT